MWDEILGAAAFIGLFLAGLIIYHVVEKRQARKAKQRKKIMQKPNHS